MKAILEFNLPEDQDEFNQAVKGGDWRSLVWDFDQYLRSNTKYAPDGMPADEYRAYEKVREHLRYMISEMNLSLDY